MRHRLLVAAGIVLTLFAVALTAGGAYAYFWDSGRVDQIAAGVSVAGVDVGGLRAADARALLAQRVAPLHEPLRIDYGTRSFRLRPAYAGLRVDVGELVDRAVYLSRRGDLADRVYRELRSRQLNESVPLRVSVDQDALAGFVDRIAKVVDMAPRAATVAPSPDAARLVLRPSVDGVAVRREALTRMLAAALVNPDAARTLTVPTKAVHARWTTANVAKRYPTFVLVSRETFTLRLYKNLKLVKKYGIAVGQAGLETPRGLYSINDKQVNPWWHVPNSAWAGSLAGKIIPPGPADPIKSRWMGFYNGAGIHGTTEDWSIGTAASHGCIRMHIPDVEDLYDRVPLHTPIYVG